MAQLSGSPLPGFKDTAHHCSSEVFLGVSIPAAPHVYSEMQMVPCKSTLSSGFTLSLHVKKLTQRLQCRPMGYLHSATITKKHALSYVDLECFGVFQYGIVLDAGPSRTNLFIYQWTTTKANKTGVIKDCSSCPVQGKVPNSCLVGCGTGMG